MKNSPISEILYWVIAVISVYETFNQWDTNRQKAFLFLGFAALSFFMALFRRHYRIKFSKRKNNS